ncbi:hypothetical protein TNCV_3416951 [Trichonephila clavipes]|nr:hypothetical protein TNCV_3416951 [Trichonephila clavipes]
MPSKQRGTSPKKGNDLWRLLEHLEMWNDFMYQFRLVCDNDSTILLTRSPRKDLDNVWLQQDGTTTHYSRVSLWCSQNILLRMSNLPSMGRKLACVSP